MQLLICSMNNQVAEIRINFKKRTITVISFLLLSIILSAQETRDNHFDIGVGYGLNYGCVGLRTAYLPISYFSIEGFIGYTREEVTGGFGLSIYPISKFFKNKYRPAIRAFYGYNSMYVISDDPTLSRTFFGINFAIGNEFLLVANKPYKLNIDLIIPIRTSESVDYLDILKDNGYYFNNLFPIGLSIGLHFEF
jgi:hypothetical protein